MLRCHARCVRTTINLPDGLLTQAKSQAERSGLTLGEYVEKALRSMVCRRSPAPEPAPFRLVTYGVGSLRPGFSFDRLKEVADLRDRERVRSAFASRAAGSDDDAAP